VVIGRAVGVGLSCALALAGCIDGDIPPRPLVADPTDGSIHLVSAPGCGSLDFTVASGVLYWTEKATGKVKSVPTTGGAVKDIAAGQSEPGRIVADATTLYWIDAGTKTIMRKPIAGGSVTVFVEATSVPEMVGGENDINTLLAAAGFVFFGRYTTACKVPSEGGRPKVIGWSPDSDRGKPAALAIDATYLYQTELDHNAISRETLDGMQMGLLEGGMIKQTLAPDRIAVSVADLLIDTIALLDGGVVWAAGRALRTKPRGADELDPSRVLASSAEDNIITGFVVVDDSIYIGEGDVVERLPVTRDADAGVSTPTIVGRNQPSPSHLVADDTAIYWRTADCRINKLLR
jgi:hypothetical protein